MVIALSLDFAIFGNGHGLAVPYFDGAFYWLVDTAHDRNSGRGKFYSWFGWYGTQLRSHQWTHPKAGERRVLNGREYRPFSSSRSLLRVEVGWRLTEMDHTIGIDAQNALLRQVQRELKAL